MVMLSRREMVLAGGMAALATIVRPTEAMAASGSPNPTLLRNALNAFARHQNQLNARDYMGIVDFSAPSRMPRFHLVDLASGKSTALLVAHGRGSDPDHSGWVERFSNQAGSAASSRGAYLTRDLYDGKHGRSRRLIGLDAENSNAEARAIVVHGAWYVSTDMVHQHGKLGRSEGCFAFSEGDLTQVLDRLGSGRLIYADKIAA